MDQTLHRTRTLNVSSDNVDYFKTSNRVSIYLSDPIVADEGYILVYSLKSIGFKSTALNISENLENNRLLYEMEYDGTNWKHKWDSETNNWVTPTDKERSASYKVTYEFIIPDGYYTYEQLMEALSTQMTYNSTSGITPHNVIPSGYYYDIKKSYKDISNIIGLKFVWSETPFGFTINLLSDSTSLFTDAYIDTIYDVTEVYPSLKKISILPPTHKRKLFDFLFTNYNSNIQNRPISTPHKPGLNPPNGIQFILNCDMSTLTSPWDILNFSDEYPYIKELGNEHNYDTQNGIYPHFHLHKGIYDFKKYIAYYKRYLDPVYIDVHISLPNASYDERGHTNTLTRVFTLGTEKGNTSLFQYWDNPKKNLLTGISSISNITFDFEPQGKMWDLFNLEFCIELEISEMVDDRSLQEEQKVNVQIPVSDEITDASNSVSRASTTPLSAIHFAHKSTGLHLHKKTRFL